MERNPQFRGGIPPYLRFYLRYKIRLFVTEMGETLGMRPRTPSLTLDREGGGEIIGW